MKSLQPLARSLVAAVVAAAGCSPNIYAPPARPQPMQSARTTGARRTAVEASAGTMGEVFGPSITHATVDVRHGLSDAIDVEGNATTVGVTSGDSRVPGGATMYLGRIGLKYDPGHNGVFAAAAGAGGGTSPGNGGFVSGDLGVILAWQNRYAIPFLSFQASLSQPIGAHPIYTGKGQPVAYRTRVSAGAGLPPGYDVARTTFGFGWNAGLKLPLGGWHSAVPAPLAWVVGLGTTTLADRDSSDTYWNFSTGLDFNF